MLDVAAVLDPPLQLFLAPLKNATRTLETSKMESFATIVNGLKAANYCSKALHLKYLRGLAYTSAPLNQTTKALFNTYHFFPQYLFLLVPTKTFKGYETCSEQRPVSYPGMVVLQYLTGVHLVIVPGCSNKTSTKSTLPLLRDRIELVEKLSSIAAKNRRVTAPKFLKSMDKLLVSYSHYLH